MSLEYRTGFCPDCDADRKLERKKPNHILHFLITVVLGIFTYGIGSIIWMGIWFLIAVKFNSWTCATCGNKNSKPVFNTTEDIPKNTKLALFNTLKKSYKLILAIIISVVVIVFLFSLFSDDSSSSTDKKDKVEDKYMLRGTSKKVMIPVDKEYYDLARQVHYKYKKSDDGRDVTINDNITIQLRVVNLVKETSDAIAFASNS